MSITTTTHLNFRGEARVRGETVEEVTGYWDKVVDVAAPYNG
ncbi:MULTISPECIES: hypothetical protein [unclassified Solwaraspora]|nr:MULTISPECIES: hypothetical protein [unclassified Solwaraspora]WBB97470.1 hypothetical protein O7553_00255 [Solwaraspora sp. WMMA2059]WBC18637.1 hypothetical protein O7543_17075 [Solwaraspora sp. WMMA2080]WJK33954.1 hypothetical protein O7610_25445 [Solwaraspora sp. WMMA2065]